MRSVVNTTQGEVSRSVHMPSPQAFLWRRDEQAFKLSVSGNKRIA